MWPELSDLPAPQVTCQGTGWQEAAELWVMGRAPGQPPKPQTLQDRKKKAAQHKHGKMISMDDGRGSSLFHLHDPEEESYFKGKQGDLNNAKMLTPVAPEILFIACW